MNSNSVDIILISMVASHHHSHAKMHTFCSYGHPWHTQVMFWGHPDSTDTQNYYTLVSILNIHEIFYGYFLLCDTRHVTFVMSYTSSRQVMGTGNTRRLHSIFYTLYINSRVNLTTQHSNCYTSRRL